MSVFGSYHAGTLEIGNTGPTMPMAQNANLLNSMEWK